MALEYLSVLGTTAMAGGTNPDIREDVVLNAIETVSAQEATLFNLLGRTTAIATVHSFLNDTLDTPASLAVEEGRDYTNKQQTVPTRCTNFVETIAYPFRVSHVNDWVEHYQGGSELERITLRAMKNWANGCEYDLVNGTIASGLSGTTAKMGGILEILTNSGNYSLHNSGTALVATILDGLMKLCYDNGNGEVPTDLFVGSYSRYVIDGFTQKSNVVVNGATNTTLVRSITNFETSFGSVLIHTHRLLNATSGTSKIFGINRDKWKLAFLKKPYVDTNLSRSGPYESRAIVGALTLESRNAKTGFYAAGFLR